MTRGLKNKNRRKTAENSHVKFFGGNQIIDGNDEMIQRLGYRHQARNLRLLTLVRSIKRILRLSGQKTLLGNLGLDMPAVGE
jgi:hypothetical protein